MQKLFTKCAGTVVAIALIASPSLAGPESTYGSATSSRTFTLDEAVLTALQRNPDILRAQQEIKRTKGLVIEMFAAVLPHLNATADYTVTDPKLNETHGGVSVGGGGGGGSFSSRQTDRSYNIRVQATQLVFNGGGAQAGIGAANFSHDVSFYQLRNAIDQVIATVRQQFYQALLNRALIGVQEESVRLLESQLRDQQNRFEAGTVPRFNVLQAQVALSNQQPELITARNNYRISLLQLAKTIGLDFDPTRPENMPITLVGELEYHPRHINLLAAIAMGKERRAFLKQQLATILSDRSQVYVALSGYFPTINIDGGYELRSSPFTDNFNDVSKGYFYGATGSWAIFDGGATYGRVKQARAVLTEARITFEDAVRQVELEIQQAYSNLGQGSELIASQEKNVEQAQEALRLSTARLEAGAGTQLEVLNARVELTRSQSTSLQALYTYDAALAEFDRVVGADTIYTPLVPDPLTPAQIQKATGIKVTPEVISTQTRVKTEHTETRTSSYSK